MHGLAKGLKAGREQVGLTFDDRCDKSVLVCSHLEVTWESDPISPFPFGGKARGAGAKFKKLVGDDLDLRGDLGLVKYKERITSGNTITIAHEYFLYNSTITVLNDLGPVFDLHLALCHDGTGK